MSYTDWNGDYVYEDNEPELCRKCWSEIAFCTCACDKLRLEVEELKKELAEERKLTKRVKAIYLQWLDGECRCEPAYCNHMIPLRTALEELRLGSAIKWKRWKKGKKK